MQNVIDLKSVSEKLPLVKSSYFTHVTDENALKLAIFAVGGLGVVFILLPFVKSSWSNLFSTRDNSSHFPSVESVPLTSPLPVPLDYSNPVETAARIKNMCFADLPNNNVKKIVEEIGVSVLATVSTIAAALTDVPSVISSDVPSALPDKEKELKPKRLRNFTDPLPSNNSK